MLTKDTIPKFTLYLAISLCFVLMSPAESHAAWQVLDNPLPNHSISIIDVVSDQEIWLKGSDGHVYYLSDASWTQIDAPDDPSLYTFSYSRIGTKLFASGISRTTYATNYYSYSSRGWHKLDYQSSVPVRSLISDEQGGLWAFGDWGTLLHLVDNQFHTIETPIQQHIRTGYYSSPDSLWLGTRNYGVYRYSSTNGFHQYLDSSWVEQDVLTFFDPTPSGISIALDNGQVFRIENDSIRVLSNFTLPVGFMRISKNMKSAVVYGVSIQKELFRLSSAGWTHVPTYPPRPVQSIKDDQAGNLFISGEQGFLIHAVNQPGLQFHNMADILSVEGSTNSNTQGAALVNLDGDSDLDIFIFNSDRYQPSRLYRNHGGSIFSEISFEAGLLNIQDPQLFAFGDFDQEGSIDLAILEHSASQHKLELSYQIAEAPLWKHTQTINNLAPGRNPIQILLSDPDQDADPDLLIVSRYSNGKNQGDVLLLENKWGHKLVPQYSAHQAFNSSWYRGIAEISGDDADKRTYYSYRSWAADEVIRIQDDGLFTEIGDSLFGKMDTMNTQGIALGDYDNDGDMDLFRISSEKGLQIFNYEDGLYQDQSHILLDQLKLSPNDVQYINLADFNNDSYLDAILTSSSPKSSGNLLLINNKGAGFTDESSTSGIQAPSVLGTCLGDIEGDGDIDILGFRRGTTLLWINDHDHNDNITIKQTGSSAYNNNNSSYALFYTAGHIGEQSELLGRRQSRASGSHPMATNSSDIHFGMADRNAVDIVLHSNHGRTIEYYNVRTGTVLELPEYTGLRALLHRVETIIKRIVNTPRIAIGLLGLFINLLGQFYFAIRMKKRFHWPDLLIHVSGTINLGVYLVIFYVSDFGKVWFTFALPLLTAQSINLVIIILQLLIHKISEFYAHGRVDDQLLQKVMIFAHGEWALKNINGLILYFQNYESASKSELNMRIRERVDTFLDLTVPAINDLLTNVQKAEFDANSIREIRAGLNLLASDIKSIEDNWRGDARTLANRLAELLDTIRAIKQQIYADFSTDLTAIIKQLLQTMEEDINRQQVKVEVQVEVSDGQMALISQNDLLAIMDNCVRNSLQAMRDQERKILRVRIFEFAPRLRVQIIDTGVGITSELEQQIFDPGFSNSGGTGLGLFQAREILKKYAGTINLDRLSGQDNTMFTIDLHKGVSKQ